MEKHIKAPISKEVSRKLRAGDYVYITGTIYTARDAAHKRMDDALKNGEKVQLVGFGTFEVRQRAARKGRNPQTKAEIKIPASKAPVFKAGKALKDLVNKK